MQTAYLDLTMKTKYPETNLTCNEEINYDIIEERKIVESNSKETSEFMNEENFIKNKNNRRNYDELNYKVIEDENIDNVNLGENEQILMNDGNLIKAMKCKKYNDDINYEDFEKRRIHENFDTEKIKQLSNKEYLLKNDYDNDEKFRMKSDFKDIKKKKKRLTNVIINKIKNEGNVIKDQNISEKFVSQSLKCFMDLIPILLENKNECYAKQTRSQLNNLRKINMNKNEDNMKNKFLKNVDVTNKVQKKHGRSRKIIQEVKLQKSILKRGIPVKL